MPHKNSEKKKQYNREWNRAHPESRRKSREKRKEKQYEYNRRYNAAVGRNTIRKYSKHIRETLGCAVCGERTACCLDFHHVEPSTKTERLSKLSAIEFAEEIGKCIVLCKNCHAKTHAGLIDISGIDAIDTEQIPPVPAYSWGTLSRGLSLVEQNGSDPRS